jgi:hypothetical protein
MSRSLCCGAAAALALTACAPPPLQPPAAHVQATPIPAEALAPFIARVEAVRGARFREPVRGFEIAPEDVPRLLDAEFERIASRERLAAESRLASALGLAPPGADLRALFLELASGSIAGMYSETGRAFYAVAGAESAGAASGDALEVHELTHALQDQQGELLGALAVLEGDDDVAFALAALLEGEATWVELRDAAAHGGPAPPTPAEFDKLFRVQIAPTGSFPRLLAEAATAPYPLGYALADALARRGGVAAFDVAHADPPLSSEELLHPEQYLDPALRTPLAQLARDPHVPGCRVATSNSYGELGMRVWLLDRGLAAPAAEAGAAGWDADRAWLFDCGGEARAAWLVQWDDAAAVQRLERVLTARLGASSAISLDRSGRRLLVSADLAPPARAQLLALAEAPRIASFAAYLRAHPEAAARLRELRP